MAVPIVIIRALPTAARALAKPRVFKRFLGTRAGKRATLKYGTMLIKSKDVRNSVGKFIKNNGSFLRSKKEYRQNEQEYAKLVKKIEKLEQQLADAKLIEQKMQELTFTLGRQVVQMRHLLEKMDVQRQQYAQEMLAEFRRFQGLDKTR